MIKDLTGLMFGQMTVLGFSHKNNKNKPYWFCRCSCGVEKIARGDSLKSGRIVSCGCSKQKEDQTGKKYGLLTVVGFGGINNGQYYWNTVCECGNTKTAQLTHLKSGNVRSCGCLKEKKDLTGMRFGRWLVLGFDRREGDKYYWNVVCDCGKHSKILAFNLTNSLSQSCGCLAQEIHTKHGMSKTRVYSVWEAMIQRCESDTSESYLLYKGRGIKVCDKWRTSFVEFYNDMGDRPSDSHQIDRIDNNGDYEPGNCRWVLSSENNRNKRSNHNITFDNRTQCLMDWCKELGFKYTTLANRLNKLGWPIEKALTTPVGS